MKAFHIIYCIICNDSVGERSVGGTHTHYTASQERKAVDSGVRTGSTGRHRGVGTDPNERQPPVKASIPTRFSDGSDACVSVDTGADESVDTDASIVASIHPNRPAGPRGPAGGALFAPGTGRVAAKGRRPSGQATAGCQRGGRARGPPHVDPAGGVGPRRPPPMRRRHRWIGSARRAGALAWSGHYVPVSPHGEAWRDGHLLR